MSDDLVKRLRTTWDADRSIISQTDNWMRERQDAADRIEKLEATNARLETEAKIQAEEIDKTRRRADKWQSMVLDCEEYLKFGETPAERIEREINDCLALMKLLETKQVRIEELEAKNEHAWNMVAKGDSDVIKAVSRNRELEAKLAEAVDEKLDAIDTLDAWFDRRKLAHEAIDQAVIDAASGYLRTSRVGGMSQKESDLVLGVIQDMARLSVFADLFARTALAELKGEK